MCKIVKFLGCRKVGKITAEGRMEGWTWCLFMYVYICFWGEGRVGEFCGIYVCEDKLVCQTTYSEYDHISPRAITKII